jgi:hypothetical protein
MTIPTARPSSTRSYPVDEFLQALTAQLDRAQDALSLKVSGTNRPLTWALKDLAIDLRVFVEVNDGGKVLLRSAGPNEEGASTIHLNLTTITRPMVEENSWSFRNDEDPRGISELQTGAAKFDDNDQRKLDWMGIRTVGQLKQLDPMEVQAVVGIPMMRLQAALAAAARPTVMGHEVVRGLEGGAPLLRIKGANLTDGVTPEVRLAGHPVEVLEATPRQLLVRPLSFHRDGQVEVFTAGQRVTGFFDLGHGQVAPQSHATVGVGVGEPASPDAAAAPTNGHGNGNGNGQVHSKGTTP